jgi:hypothetical protein
MQLSSSPEARARLSARRANLAAVSVTSAKQKRYSLSTGFIGYDGPRRWAERNHELCIRPIPRQKLGGSKVLEYALAAVQCLGGRWVE